MQIRKPGERIETQKSNRITLEDLIEKLAVIEKKLDKLIKVSKSNTTK